MKRLIFPIMFGICGCATLIALGVWQVQRLHWKEALLAGINARIHDAPVALPETLTEADHEYMPVAVSGQIGEGEIHVLHPVTGQSPEYRLILPLTLKDGNGRILADVGAISLEQKPVTRARGDIDVTGSLHWPDETSGWTPDPDLEENIWYARDVDLMAEALDTRPVLVVAREHSRPDLAAIPQPVTTRGIPNDHLGYAITWFGLALTWALMSLVLIRRTLRNAK